MQCFHTIRIKKSNAFDGSEIKERMTNVLLTLISKYMLILFDLIDFKRSLNKNFSALNKH